jgi:hypothetical protein
MAIAAIVFLLPSALRPPQSPPTQTAELSPDAPPDENQDSIISTLNRGQSGTGDGTADVGEGQGEGQTIFVNGQPQQEVAAAPPPAACPYGYGKPPRQTFSIYSPPCAPAFTGDNGGATSPGVTANEIRVVVSGGTEGWADQVVTDSNTGAEKQPDKTWRILQQWFNSHYQFYGRKLRFYKMDQGAPGTSTNPDDDRRAKVARMQTEIHAFAVSTLEGGVTRQEAARRKILSFGEQGNDQFQDSFYQENRPYIWSWRASATTLRKLIAEYACGKLANRPAKFAGPAYINTQRVFGVVYDSVIGKGDAGAEIDQYMQQTCGVKIKRSIGIAATGDSNTAATRLASDGVTTVINTLTWGGTTGMIAAASSIGYNPEWVFDGEGAQDLNYTARANDQAQMAHAFGISGLEIEDAGAFSNDNTEYFNAHRAYHEIDPANDPDRGPSLFFSGLEMLANGIQMAGPNLTPQTFEKGLHSIPLRQGPPNWAVNGGYRPGNYGYATGVGEIWWNAAGTDSVGNPAVWCWTRNAARWTLGHLPPGETTVHAEGICKRSNDWANY